MKGHLVLSRPRLVVLAARAKKLGAVDLALRYNPVVRHRVTRSIGAFADADRAGRHSLAEALTASVLAAARHTAYGRDFGPRLQDWPVLRKEQVRDCPADFVRGGLARIPAATSGSTGMPLQLVRSATCVAAEQVFLDRIVPVPGLTWARARVAVLRADTVKDPADQSPPFGRVTHRGCRLVLSSPHFSPETLSWYLDALADFRPDILWMTPTTGSNLLHLLATTGRRLQIPLVITSSESPPPGFRANIKLDLGACLVDYYGLSERTCFAASAVEDQYFFEPAYGRVELMPSDEDDTTDGQRHVAIVATGYWNSAMPLVRYDTGDRAMVPVSADRHELEAIALGLRPFRGIAERSSNFIYRTNGLRFSALNLLPRDVDNLLRMQAVQQRIGSVLLRVLVRPGFGPNDRAKLEANARAALPPDIDFHIEIADRLETTEQGKTPFVIRQSAEIATEAAALSPLPPGPAY